MFQHRDITEIEKILNDGYENICDWFVDYNLSIHFGDNKIISILFADARRAKNIRKLNTVFPLINASLCKCRILKSGVY